MGKSLLFSAQSLTMPREPATLSKILVAREGSKDSTVFPVVLLNTAFGRGETQGNARSHAALKRVHLARNNSPGHTGHRVSQRKHKEIYSGSANAEWRPLRCRTPQAISPRKYCHIPWRRQIIWNCR